MFVLPSQVPLPTRVRYEYWIASILLCLLMLSQIRLPLTYYQPHEFAHKVAIPSTNIQVLNDAKEYIEQNQNLIDDEIYMFDVDGDSSWSSSDEGVKGRTAWNYLRSPVVQIFHDYVQANSQAQMDKQEDECHDRTNRGSSADMREVLEDENVCPELASRKFLVVDWIADPCQAWNQTDGISTLKNLVHGIAWAMIMDRTILVRQMSTPSSSNDEKKEEENFNTSCDEYDEGCQQDKYNLNRYYEDCNVLAKLDSWVPSYESWKREYGWTSTAVGAWSFKEAQSMRQEPTDSHKTIQVLQMESPVPPVPETIMENLSNDSIENLEILLYSNMWYGMIIDEALQFISLDSDDLELEESSVDDDAFMADLGEDLTTRRYVIQAKHYGTCAKQVLLKAPCIVYQVGSFPMDPCECQVQVVNGEDDSTLASVLEIFALAGHAWDGAVLDPEWPLTEYLTQILLYRGQMHSSTYRLDVCWKKDEGDSPLVNSNV